MKIGNAFVHRPITTNFCTPHDSNTVVMCAKLWCDRLCIFKVRALQMLTEFRIRSKYHFWDGRLGETYGVRFSSQNPICILYISMFDRRWYHAIMLYFDMIHNAFHVFVCFVVVMRSIISSIWYIYTYCSEMLHCTLGFGCTFLWSDPEQNRYTRPITTPNHRANHQHYQKAL